MASEDLENSLKGLPDTKTTRYIEMGKYEMEVRQNLLETGLFLVQVASAHVARQTDVACAWSQLLMPGLVCSFHSSLLYLRT